MLESFSAFRGIIHRVKVRTYCLLTLAASCVCFVVTGQNPTVLVLASELRIPCLDVAVAFTYSASRFPRAVAKVTQVTRQASCDCILSQEKCETTTEPNAFSLVYSRKIRVENIASQA
jgi:hypothetical protein